MASELHVSISAETIATVGPLEITNAMFTGSIVTVLLIAFALYFGSKELQKKKINYLQNSAELVVEGIYNLCVDVAGRKKASVFFPLIATAVIFIVLNNWIGLLPGVGTIGVNEPIHIAQTTEVHAAEETHQEESGHLAEESDSHEEESHTSFFPLFRASTADINTTIALALISVFLTQYYGVKYLGMGYFSKFLNFKQGPIFTFVGLLEIISEFAKIISFAFRLFGNIFAGEVLLAVIAFLVPVVAPIPFIGLEIFVGFIQALVFGMLTLVFINMATESHEH